jgi:hypothetical protein
MKENLNLAPIGTASFFFFDIETSIWTANVVKKEKDIVDSGLEW